MQNYPLWKKLAVALICVAGVVFAMPNAFYAPVEQANDARAAQEAGEILDADQQAALEGWPSFLPSGLVNLGLDLRGGVSLLVEVQFKDVYKERTDALWSGLRDALAEDRDGVGRFRQEDSTEDAIRVRLNTSENMPRALEIARGLTQPVTTLTGAGARDFDVVQDGPVLVMTMSEAEKVATNDRTMAQSLEIIRRRVDETGTREPTIQRQGTDRILIQVPGLGSAEELLALLGTTAKLTFHQVTGIASSANENPGVGNMILPSLDQPGVFYRLNARSVVTGEQLVDAQPSFDERGRPAVSFRFNATGGRLFGAYTAQHIGEQFAIVLDGQVVSAPEIIAHIAGGSGIITGRFSTEETTRLAILLRAGALPAELKVMEQRTVGPELGQDSIDAGRIACVVAFVAVMVFMMLSYGVFGLFANIALILNVTLILALLSVIGATLTLPGIAGIVLTIGMAVDANVLVFERIREELRSAKRPARAIQLGYEKALSAIIDANITTLIAATILFAMGSGPVKGFAVTLGLGIVTSVFTAIYVTRAMVSTWVEARNPKTLEV
ncbi:protein translocase subunit SecD [Halovulum sp. GXIMD14793]